MNNELLGWILQHIYFIKERHGKISKAKLRKKLAEEYMHSIVHCGSGAFVTHWDYLVEKGLI